jgi:recombination protein RecT
MPPQNTAVQKLPTKPGDVRSYIQSDAVKKQIAMVLPKHLTADVMARVVCTAILKTPRLAECRIESLLQSIMLLSQFGMLPDGRSAHLIPYFNTKANCYDCQAIIDWKGKVARASQNGVENINADVVCFNDKFTWKVTTEGLQFEHEIDFKNPERGDMFAAYCVWRHAGKFSGVIMTKLEIDGIRKRSKLPDKGPWNTDYSEMAKKTVVHRASKLWPLDAKFAEAIEIQEVTAPIVDLPELPIVDDAPPMGGKTPLAENNPPSTEGETPRAAITRALDEAGVPFDMFTAEVAVRNIAKDSYSWASYADAPDAVFETLAAQPKTIAAIVKKFGKKVA